MFWNGVLKRIWGVEEGSRRMKNCIIRSNII
jgi:hypothetical protein